MLSLSDLFVVSAVHEGERDCATGDLQAASRAWPREWFSGHRRDQSRARLRTDLPRCRTHRVRWNGLALLQSLSLSDAVSPPAKCATGKSRCQRTPVRSENILALQIARSQNKLRSKGVDATALFKRYLAIFVLDERNALESRTCTRHTDRASTDLPCAGRQPEFSAVAARSVAGLCRVRCAARKLCSDGRRGQRCTRPQDLLHCANKMRDHRRIQGRYA